MSSRPIPWHFTPSEAKAGIGTADHKSGIACGLNVRKSPENIAIRCLSVCWHHSVAIRLARKKSCAHLPPLPTHLSTTLDALLRIAFYSTEISKRYLSGTVAGLTCVLEPDRRKDLFIRAAPFCSCRTQLPRIDERQASVAACSSPGSRGEVHSGRSPCLWISE